MFQHPGTGRVRHPRSARLPPDQAIGHFVQDDKEKAAAEADAAMDRLQKGLRAARSIVRDYRAKLCRKAPVETRKAERKSAFQLDR